MYCGVAELEFNSEGLLFVGGVLYIEEALHPAAVDVLFVAHVERNARRVCRKGRNGLFIGRVEDVYRRSREAVHIGSSYPERNYHIFVFVQGEQVAVFNFCRICRPARGEEHNRLGIRVCTGKGVRSAEGVFYQLGISCHARARRVGVEFGIEVFKAERTHNVF